MGVGVLAWQVGQRINNFFLPVFTAQACARGDRAATLAAALFKVFQVPFWYFPVATEFDRVWKITFAKVDA